jgi:hypothetical protein
LQNFAYWCIIIVNEGVIINGGTITMDINTPATVMNDAAISPIPTNKQIARREVAELTDNSKIRKQCEAKNLFADPKYARQAWKSVGTAILASPAVAPVADIDTLQGAIEDYSYKSLVADTDKLKAAYLRPGEIREPTEIEMIMRCQILRARFDTGAAVFVRDTLGAKPVDESKVEATVSNPYETMTDDELEALAAYRERRDAAQMKASTDSTDTDDTPTV